MYIGKQELIKGKNAQHLTCISNSVREIGTDREVIISENKTAHLNDFNIYTGSTEGILQKKNLRNSLDLVLVNAEVKCGEKNNVGGA